MIRYLLLTAVSDLLGTIKIGVDHYRSEAAQRFVRTRAGVEKDAN